MRISTARHRLRTHPFIFQCTDMLGSTNRGMALIDFMGLLFHGLNTQRDKTWSNLRIAILLLLLWPFKVHRKRELHWVGFISLLWTDSLITGTINKAGRTQLGIISRLTSALWKFPAMTRSRVKAVTGCWILTAWTCSRMEATWEEENAFERKTWSRLKRLITLRTGTRTTRKNTSTESTNTSNDNAHKSTSVNKNGSREQQSSDPQTKQENSSDRESSPSPDRDMVVVNIPQGKQDSPAVIKREPYMMDDDNRSTPPSFPTAPPRQCFEDQAAYGYNGYCTYSQTQPNYSPTAYACGSSSYSSSPPNAAERPATLSQFVNDSNAEPGVQTRYSPHLSHYNQTTPHAAMEEPLQRQQHTPYTSYETTRGGWYNGHHQYGSSPAIASDVSPVVPSHGGQTQHHQTAANHPTFPNVREMFESQRLIVSNGSVTGCNVQSSQGQFGAGSATYNSTSNSGSLYWPWYYCIINQNELLMYSRRSLWIL